MPIKHTHHAKVRQQKTFSHALLCVSIIHSYLCCCFVLQIMTVAEFFRVSPQINERQTMHLRNHAHESVDIFLSHKEIQEL